MLKRRCWFYVGIFLYPIAIIFFNEYLIHYLTAIQCKWPATGRTNILILADTHLLGFYRGYTLDRWRRDSQMYRSFQTAVTMFQPRAIFFLGDLFDEGLLGQNNVFASYVDRFNSIFYTKENIEKYILMGNHDVGYHREIFPQRLNRFTKHFKVPNAVEQVEIDGNIFVLVNSMAMEGDFCHLCSEAVREIERISRVLNCTQNYDERKCNERLNVDYSRPLLMQHFPLYRKSDEECEETPDLAPPRIREEKFKQAYDCLSADSTSFLIEKLRPRAAFGGHVHYGCKKWWKQSGMFWEYTVPSFSCRNNRRPSYLLVSVSPSAISVSSCFVPDEYLVIIIYVVALLLWLLLVIITLLSRYRLRKYHKLVNEESFSKMS